MWIVGVLDYEILAIVMAPDSQAPHLAQKSQIKTFKMKPPLLELESDTKSSEKTRPQIEAEIFVKQIQIEHETFRIQNWQNLKHFRSKYDNEYHLSVSIMD